MTGGAHRGDRAIKRCLVGEVRRDFGIVRRRFWFGCSS
jgi:hypothetical protein